MAHLRSTAVVGRGTLSIVRRVRRFTNDEEVFALKCVSKARVKLKHQREALLLERKINAHCYHPCIVQFIKTLQDCKNIYFLTEFLGGGDLFQAMRAVGRFSTEHAQFYIATVAMALKYLHKRSIIHRDLRPEHVLLDVDGRAKVADFGCCKWCGSVARATTLVGAPEYFAPEVVLGMGYTHSVDWWALGVMMYELIVGCMPFGDAGGQNKLPRLFGEILEKPLYVPEHLEDRA